MSARTASIASLFPAPWRHVRTLAWLALAAVPAMASAVLITGPGGTAEQGRRTVIAAVPASGAASTPSLDLATGRVDAVDLGAARLQLNGKAVPLDAARLRVIGPDGRAAAASALKAGQQIRFALEPGVAPVRRIVLIYIDR